MLLSYFLKRKESPKNKMEIVIFATESFIIDKFIIDLKSASNLNGNLNCSKELEHYAS